MKRHLKIDDLGFNINRQEDGSYYVTATKGQISKSWICRTPEAAVDMARDWLLFEVWNPQPYYQRA